MSLLLSYAGDRFIMFLHAYGIQMKLDCILRLETLGQGIWQNEDRRAPYIFVIMEETCVMGEVICLQCYVRCLWLCLFVSLSTLNCLY